MEINPIKALRDSFEKLIVEHGSSHIQEKHIVFLKDQLSFAEREISKLLIKNSEFQSKELKSQAEIKQLRDEIISLENKNADLKQKIQTYEQPNHGKPLEKIKVDILLFLWKLRGSFTADEISMALSIDPQIVLHHLTELNKDRIMVQKASRANAPPSWKLSDDGRGYLINNNLIS